MGAWGYRPFENDSALDWLREVERSVAVKIYDGLTLMDATHEAIAAAQLLLDCTREGTVISLKYDAMNWRTRPRRIFKRGVKNPSKSLFDIAIKKLDALWKSEWPEEWNSPADSRKVLGSIRRALARRQRVLIRKAEERRARVKIVRKSGTRRKKAA